jgi:diguanylate cyclase (GGDEF)-like protein
MKTRAISKLPKRSQPVNSLTDVLGQSERVKDIVEECADELSSVNAGLKYELKDVESLPGVEQVLEKSQAVESKVQNASEELALVNQALKEEVEERLILEERLATATKQGDEARHAALHDPLTGLPNRALFNDRLEHGLAKAKRHGYSLAVMFLDLDDFKKINDTHGHEVGDAVLQTIAGRLKETTRSEDTVCRHGGDEFLYMLLELRNEQDITVIAKKIIKAIQAPCEIRLSDTSLSLSTSPSIGIAIYPIDGTTADALVNNADKAMYWAKRNKLGYSFGGNPHSSLD